MKHNDPFKCPECGSRFFGPIFEGGDHVGRYCKGWPSGFDRSYIPCRGRHEERFSDVQAGDGVATDGADHAA